MPVPQEKPVHSELPVPYHAESGWPWWYPSTALATMVAAGVIDSTWPGASHNAPAAKNKLTSKNCIADDLTIDDLTIEVMISGGVRRRQILYAAERTRPVESGQHR